ncbi:condensation domain-containing protein [Actinomadura sp. NEAU-AAG7]|uniref:phthiocerol/phthiodiolone dimycocerosyl transferase family protein n=1 Tax=Actinomadura sp. NEAU-AAG7 TaxID=2839640 RepID=UPI001BE473BC|nr:condensation domain-containing protein [Actinomadura sp. NEAU-AAG7]MBT2210865.1 hypothetical protein [Actinomadura sp. NEAU-AAG7]
MERKLNAVEAMLVGDASTRITVVCTLRGGIDADALAAAFAAKVAEHPALRSHVVRTPDGLRFEPLDPADHPVLQVRPGGRDALEEEIQTPLDPGEALVRAVLLRGDDADGEDREDVVVFAVDHAVSDGISVVTLHEAFWDHYTRAVAGAAPDAPPRAVPEPVQVRLRPWSEEDISAHVARRVAEAKEMRPVTLPYGAGGEPGIRLEQIRLSAADTEAISAAAKRDGLSRHWLVSGALLTALRRHLDAPSGPANLSCLTPVDLRSRLDPEVDREDMVLAASWFTAYAEVPEDGEATAVGARLNEGFRRARERGDLELEILGVHRLLEDPSLLMPSLVVTNAGAISTPVTPPGVEITGFRWFGLAAMGPLTAFVLTLDGRLTVEFAFNGGFLDEGLVRAFASSVREVLAELAFSGATPDGAAGHAAAGNPARVNA